MNLLRLAVLPALLAAFTFTSCTSLPKENARNGPATCPPHGPFWQTRDGVRIAYRSWPATGAPRAVMAALPGWDSSACDWELLARKLSRQGIAVYASGRRGDWGVPDADYAKMRHQRGDIDTWENWARDYAEFTHFVARRHPGAPVVFAGHSMGTLEVLNVAGDSRWSGVRPAAVVLYSPALTMIDPSCMIRLRGWIGRLVTRPEERFGEAAAIEQSGEAIFNDWRKNAQVIHSADRAPSYTFHFIREAAALGKAAGRAAPAIRTPVLWFLGGADVLLLPDKTQPGAPERFERSLRQAPGEGHPLTQGSHCLNQEEPECSVAARKTATWLRHQLAR